MPGPDVNANEPSFDWWRKTVNDDGIAVIISFKNLKGNEQ